MQHGPHYAMHDSNVNVYLVSVSIESVSHAHLHLSWLANAVYMGERLRWPAPREGLCMWIFPAGNHARKMWILYLFCSCVNSQGRGSVIQPTFVPFLIL